jgi:predicted ester cyclase
LGVSPTGKEVVSTGMNLFRLVNGKIAEVWVESDDLGELQQLGVITLAQ